MRHHDLGAEFVDNTISLDSYYSTYMNETGNYSIGNYSIYDIGLVYPNETCIITEINTSANEEYSC